MPEEGEFELLARLAPFMAPGGDDLLVGSGDDAAVLNLDGRGICLAVDVLVDGVHFRRDLSSLEDVGWKAVAVNCSDIAAMGGVPTVAVVGLCRPAELPGEEVEQLYAGLDEACRRWNVRLVGGDTVSSQALALSVTVLGDVDPDAVVTRSGARPGDRIVVVGDLGGPAAALAQVAAGLDPDHALLEAHRRPVAQIEAGRTLAAGGATAMIDVSDGFGADLGHICVASGVGAEVDGTALPIAEGVVAAANAVGADPLDFVVGGGDDYALVATVPAAVAQDVCDATGGVVVGDIVEGEPTARMRLADGSLRELAGLGWDHYRESRT